MWMRGTMRWRMIVSVRALSKAFDRKTVLHSISFSVKRGEIIGFLGPNGAGKTTMMRLLTGFLKTHHGSISVSGYDPLYQREKISEITGYLPENNPLYGDMTVKEYLAFISRLKGKVSPGSLVKAVGVGDVLHKKIETLSRGYKQRVGLIAAMMNEPDLLILDEPTSGLDPIEQDKIRKVIKNFSKKNSVIFSTHILSEVEDIATRLIILNKGKIVFDGKKPRGKGVVNALFKKLIK